MLGNERVLGIICGRGGSKGLPGKNIRPLAGRPMIAWSVDAARTAHTIDRTIVSTDCEEIAEAARAAGADVPFLRPPELSSDTAGLVDVLLHALDMLGEHYDILVLLQATSPLRIGADIDACVNKLADGNTSTAVTVARSPKPLHWSLVLDDKGLAQPMFGEDAFLGRRQTQQTVFLPNGAVYAARVPWLRQRRTFWSFGETVAMEMPPERSVDVDTLLDFRLAEVLIADRLSCRRE